MSLSTRANVLNGHVKEYKTSANVLLKGQEYHEVVYVCDPGFKMSETMQGHMFCQQGGWMGLEPYCEEDPDACEEDPNVGVEDPDESDQDDSEKSNWFHRRPHRKHL